MVTARRAAVMALAAWRRDGAWSGVYLDKLAREADLDSRETALAQRLTLGVLQNMALCDFYLQKFSTQKLKRLEPAVLDILRVGAYQILFLDRVPDFSAVNESVNLAKKMANPRASGFVNALLRKLTAEKDRLPAPGGDPVQRLSVLYSHPVWFVQRMVELLGEEEAEALLALDNKPAPITIQVNGLRTKPAELFQETGAVPSGVFDDAGLLESGSVEKLPAFREGKFFVQDLSARCAVEAAGPKPGDCVLDLCAAPGGKSFMAAVKMGGRGQLRAFDLHEAKVPRIQDGARRLGIDCIQAEQGDASVRNPALENWADVVFADVPCSGMGIIRKKPEIRYKAPESLTELPGIQLAILKNAANYVKPGGVLLYSTCTLLEEENEQVVSAFLTENPAFQAEAFTLPAPYAGAETGMLTIWPQRCGTDGFFVAKLRRSNET